MAFSRFDFAFAGSGWIFFLLALFFIAFSVFIYRYTLPKVSMPIRFLLTGIRSLIFLLALLLVFEPLLSFVTETTNTKNIFVFLDESNSIAAKDSLQRIEKMKILVKELNSESIYKVKYFSFGSKIDSLSPNNSKIVLDRPQTNYELLDRFLEKKAGEIKSAVVVSDGIITEGIDPSYHIKKLSFPIFTIGIGDTSSIKDAQINSVTHNQFIYTGKETKIESTVLNTGLGNKSLQIYLCEENKIIDSKSIVLNSSGMNKVQFNYEPITEGEKKLKVEILSIPGDQNLNNNSSTFFIDVLNTKIKVALIAGSPSADVSALSNALESDKNIQLSKLVQVAQGKDWNSKEVFSLDSAKILFLVDFPSKNISSQLFNQVIRLIDGGKPFFISISNTSDPEKLKLIEKYLPASIGNYSTEPIQVQAELNSQVYSSNFTQLENSAFIWNNLPPINQFNSDISSKPESHQIVNSKLRELVLKNPLITIRSIANQRSFLLNGWNFWRWSLESAEKNSEFFRIFVNEIVKWLNLSFDKKQFIIRTNKKVYSHGEPVEFTAELYDKAFNPVDTAQVNLTISQGEKKFDLAFTPNGNGTYITSFTPDLKGDYHFDGRTTINGEKQVLSSGRFNISNISTEKLNIQMRIDYLKQLASSTNGMYFSVDDYALLKKRLIELYKKNEPVIERKYEYELWNNHFILILIVSLFAIEWFLRKRIGMI